MPYQYAALPIAAGRMKLENRNPGSRSQTGFENRADITPL